MSMSTATIQSMPSMYDGEVLEKVLLENDLAKLSAVEKVTHIKNVCLSLGLNPLTRPIQLIKFQGKEIMYATKDATEQLRSKHNVSITKLDTKMVADDIYSVTAYAMLPSGRTDSSTGIVNVKGLIGEAMCNAMLKAETKAKRRATLSICGLGFIDESEVDSMKGAKKIDVVQPSNQKTYEGEQIQPKIEHQEERDIDQDVLDISWCNSLDELHKLSSESYKYWVQLLGRTVNSNDKKIVSEKVKRIIDAKDKRKKQLELDSVDVETGEIKDE
jgi:hypothetical protein